MSRFILSANLHLTSLDEIRTMPMPASHRADSFHTLDLGPVCVFVHDDAEGLIVADAIAAAAVDLAAKVRAAVEGGAPDAA